jgi:energy-coupling factor transporter ATP-binding protein EcfA2
MKAVVTVERYEFKMILEYLHYKVNPDYTRHLSEVSISPSYMVFEPEFEYLNLKFSVISTENYQIGHTFRKYSELTIEGPSAEIESFVTLAVESIKKNRFQNDFLVIYKSEYNHWSEYKKLDQRSMDNIYLPNSVKKDLLQDIINFYKPEHIKMYNDLGINHSRMYMLYGIPGTGKSTLIRCVASHFKKHIAYVYIKPDMDYDNFRNLMSNVPDNSIVCFEDVDSLFVEERKQKTGLTFSGFINVFDGVDIAKNLMVFFTTNDLEVIDKAIIRRISYFIEFKYAAKEQIHEMFNTFFPQYTDSFDKFYENVKNTKTTINVMEKFFIKYIFEDIVEKSYLFGKFANGELLLKQGNESKMYM